MKNSKGFDASTRLIAILAVLSAGLPPAVHAFEDTGSKGPALSTSQAGLASAVEKQKASIAAMAESISRQRASIQRQAGGTPGDGFFTLGPPEHMAISLPPCPPLPDSDVDALVQQAASKEGLDPRLLKNVMKQESAFRPCAVSPKGALGLMQLMPSTASQLSVADPFDPTSNVNAGAKFLKQMLDRYKGDVALALGAYNAGPANVDAANGVPKIPETINYVNQILGALSNVDSPNAAQPPVWPSSVTLDEPFNGLNLGQQMINALTH